MPIVKGRLTPLGLTQKETDFVKNLLITKNGTDAVERSYDVKSRANAHSMAKELFKKPRIQDALRRAFIKAGLTENSFAEYIKDGIVKAKEEAKFTGSDYFRGLELYAKVSGFYNRPQIRQDLKVTLHKLPTKELKVELEKRMKFSSDLINSLNS